MRLKLSGGDRSIGKRSVVPLAGHGLRPASLRRQASRPQLKRDPLGSRLLSGRQSVVLGKIELRGRRVEAEDSRWRLLSISGFTAVGLILLVGAAWQGRGVVR